jgi:hypothetical protein
MVKGTMARGYIIDLRTPRITLGLTRMNTAGFKFLQLRRTSEVTDWIAPTVWLRVPSAHIGPMEASLLVDTGLGCSIVQAPLGVAPPQIAVQYFANPQEVAARVQVADTVRFVLAVQGWDAPLYVFKVGQAGQAPDYVLWGFDTLDGGMPFVNAGLHALSQFDYLFDDDNGRLGFRFQEQQDATQVSVRVVLHMRAADGLMVQSRGPGSPGRLEDPEEGRVKSVHIGVYS